jgi:hypothetical protein
MHGQRFITQTTSYSPSFKPCSRSDYAAFVTLLA